MPQANPIGIYGLHQAVFENRTTKARFSARVFLESEMNLTQEQNPLQGGSSPYPWNTAPGYADSTLSMKFAEMPLELLKFLCGDLAAAITEDTDGDPSGYVSALANVTGTSAFNATTGIASVGIVSSSNPVFGNYLVKATGAAAVDVYLDNTLDGVDYVDNACKITSTPLTITAATPVTIPGTNIQLTGGSGTIALTTGDIASFSARPKNNYAAEYLFGKTGSNPPEFALTVFTEKLGSGDQYRVLHLPRVKANGLTFPLSAKEWAEPETEALILQDSALGYAGKYIIIGR